MSTYPRAEALDALDHLACKLKAVAALMTTEPQVLEAEEVFGLQLIFEGAAAQISAAKAKLEKLIPTT
jgi:hypothetical protein